MTLRRELKFGSILVGLLAVGCATLDVGVDYTLPIVAADGQISLSGVSGDIETEVEGFALRLGAGVVL